MMDMQCRVIYINAAQHHKRKFRTKTKAAYQQAVKHWHTKHLPKHFRAGASTKYGYKKRSFKHNQRKRRKYGHAAPLVYSGLMRGQVKRYIRLSGTSTMASGVMNGPRYLYAYRKDYNQPDKAAEIMRTTGDETQDIGQFLDRDIKARIEANQEVEVVDLS